jgi:hypothetical protein
VGPIRGAPLGKAPRFRLIIQSDAVRKIFRGVLRGTDQAPSVEMCTRVAKQISIAAVSYRFGLELVSPVERREALAIRRLIRSLNNALAAQFERLRAMHPDFRDTLDLLREMHGNTQETDFISDHLARIATARAALGELPPVYESQIWPKTTWKDAAWDLQRIFNEAMRSVYPDREFGHSLGGPAVRFVHELLPLVAGATVSEGAIVTELKRSHRGGTKAGTQSVPGQMH